MTPKEKLDAEMSQGLQHLRRKDLLKARGRLLRAYLKVQRTWAKRTGNCHTQYIGFYYDAMASSLRELVLIDNELVRRENLTTQGEKS